MMTNRLANMSTKSEEIYRKLSLKMKEKISGKSIYGGTLMSNSYIHFTLARGTLIQIKTHDSEIVKRSELHSPDCTSSRQKAIVCSLCFDGNKQKINNSNEIISFNRLSLNRRINFNIHSYSN